MCMDVDINTGGNHGITYSLHELKVESDETAVLRGKEKPLRTTDSRATYVGDATMAPANIGGMKPH